MKEHLKEIAKELTPQTNIEEFISYCKDLDEINYLFDEYCKIQLTKLSTFIAYILRHNPAAVGISIDTHGWARVNDLIDGINRTGRHIDFETLNIIVLNDSKSRYSFNDDKTKIRANQGHSISVDLQMTEINPPDTLYHGTTEKYLNGIKEFGILKKSRNFVHLSSDIDTAMKVGARHGKAVVLVINAKEMARCGHKFYLSANGVWQTDYVPFSFVCERAVDFMGNSIQIK